MPLTAAALEPAPSERRRCTLSSTTMASSTMRPAASTNASSVKMLIEKPSIQLTASVPNSEIGIATAGMSVSRMDPVNRRMVPMTTRIEIRRVVTTSLTDPRMKVELSEMMFSLMNPSICALMSATAALTPSAMRMVLEPAWRTTLIPTTRSPFKRTKPVESAGENTTLATCAMRISSRMISEEISSSLVTAASALTSSCWSPARKLPAGTSSGAARSTAVTSATVRP